jgi:hypothetical protein
MKKAMVFDTCKKWILLPLLVLFVLAMVEKNTDSMTSTRRMEAGEGERKSNVSSEFPYQSLRSKMLDSQNSEYVLTDQQIDNISYYDSLAEDSKSLGWYGTNSLRFDWSNLPLHSEIAKRLDDHQHNCLLPVREYGWRGDSGLGSDVHVWGNHLWAGLLYGYRVKSPNPWIWVDSEACGGSLSWQCYFPGVEPTCIGEEIQSKPIIAESCGVEPFWPDTYAIPAFRAAATEFVFSRLSNVVITEARRQLNAIFGSSGIPSNLIVVHVRWGDKVMEAHLMPIDDYISAVKRLVRERKIDSVHVLLCTEDPKGVVAFKEAAPTSWNIYLDHFYTELLPYRENREVSYNLPSFIAMELKGKPGLWALGSLLVAMEANHFVLSTTSNWARLMNELRKNVLDPHCGNCTSLIDLGEGEC